VWCAGGDFPNGNFSASNVSIKNSGNGAVPVAVFISVKLAEIVRNCIKFSLKFAGLKESV
jgi:hypothetical protein